MEGLDSIGKELAGIVGERRLSRADADLDTYSRDMWPRLLFAVRDGASAQHPPHFVVWPETAREIAAIVRLARERGIPLVPYGGGSGVCGGAVPVSGGITLDLKRMTSLGGVDREEMTVDVEAGINGERFERALQHKGYTLGHFPSSIYCSTVGGWLACRAAGQMSTKYGKIEDMVAGLTVVTGRGEVIHTEDLARAAAGPNWTQLLVGSEGTLGVITSARLRVHLAPALRVLRGFEFEDATAGVEAIRRVMQRGLKPAVVRLYDEVDTLVHVFGNRESDPGESLDPSRYAPVPAPGSGALPSLAPAATERDPGFLRRVAGTLLSGSDRGGLGRAALSAALSRPRAFNSVLNTVSERISRKGCLLIVGCEGARIRTEVEARVVFAELERAGGKNIGEEPGLHWLENRYSVSYNMSKVFANGAFVDTMEVASTWERLMDMYEAVREAIGRHAFVMAHFSHAYEEGCSIYFSFAGQGDTRAEAEKIYDAIWRDGMAAVSRSGGTISHHHGVGLLKAHAMRGEHREAMEILRAVKHTFDPDNIMNPGKLGLPARRRWQA